MLASAVDTLLDRTIAPGYGKYGLTLRKRLPGWPADPPRMDGKVVLVTGAASGLGLAAAQGFASLGAQVLAVARNDKRAKDAERAITGDVRGVACDVSSVAALEALAAGVGHVDVLVNNAGVMPSERSRSVDGVEATFATHVLGPWVLMRDLGPRVERVINVVSGGMYAQALNAGDLMSERDEYNPKTFYARSKRAEMTITEQWARRLGGRRRACDASRAGPTPPGCRARWPSSGRSPVRSSVTAPRARTRSSGSAGRRNRCAAPGSSGWTAGSGPRTIGSARRRTPRPRAKRSGRSARTSPPRRAAARARRARAACSSRKRRAARRPPSDAQAALAVLVHEVGERAEPPGAGARWRRGRAPPRCAVERVGERVDARRRRAARTTASTGVVGAERAERRAQVVLGAAGGRAEVGLGHDEHVRAPP